MTKPARRWTGDAVMLVTALLMGSSYPVAKDVLAVMSPLLYSSSRYVIAGLFLLGVIALRRQPLALPRRDWLPILLLSLLGVTLFQAFWGYGIARTSPSVGSIIMTTTTTFSAVFAWMQGRRLSALGWTGIATAFAGVLLVVNNSLGRFTIALDNLEGAGFWLVSAFCWALYVDRSVPLNLRLGSLRVVAWTTFLGALILLLVALCFDSLSEFGRLDERLLGYWLYTGTFPVGVAYLGIAFGLDRLGVSRVMVYMYLIPVAGVGLAAAFFGDPLTWARVLGGLIVLLGVILTRVALDRGARLR
jgi:drug/metabolite transporter (DMT)-like permease